MEEDILNYSPTVIFRRTTVFRKKTILKMFLHYAEDPERKRTKNESTNHSHLGHRVINNLLLIQLGQSS